MINLKTPYAKIVPGTTQTIDVIFTHVNVPPGVFNFAHVQAGVNTKILLNMHNNDCYQAGIAGIADTVDGAAAWLARTIKTLGGTCMRMVGISGGGTAAITFGQLLKADVVIAIAPELQLGIPGYRSYEANTDKIYDKRYRDVTTLARGLGPRLNIAYPGWDISDYRHLHFVRQSCTARLFLIADMHAGSQHFNWRNILGAPGAVDLAEMATLAPYDSRFDEDNIWRGTAAFEAFGRAGRLTDSLLSHLLEIDPENPGMCFYAAVQKALLEEYAAAERLWRKAEASIDVMTPHTPVRARYAFCQKAISWGALKKLDEFVSQLKTVRPRAPARPAAHPIEMW